eukprot:5471031-Pleurochrysis_carterae.AAC.2
MSRADLPICFAYSDDGSHCIYANSGTVLPAVCGAPAAATKLLSYGNAFILPVNRMKLPDFCAWDWESKEVSVRPVVLAPCGRGNRKSKVAPEVAPSKIAAPMSGVIFQFVQYRMSCKRLRHTNARYGGPGQQPPAPLSGGRAQGCGAAEPAPPAREVLA